MGEDAHPTAVDNMFPESSEISWPRATRIDKCCTGGFVCKTLGLHPKRGAAPVDVYVHINHARRYNAVGAINSLRLIKGRHAEAQYFVFADNKIGHPVNAIGWVNHPATAQNKTGGHSGL